MERQPTAPPPRWLPADVPGWADLSLARSTDRRVIWAAVAIGVLADLAVRSGVAGLGGALLVAAAAGALLVTGGLMTWPARALVGAAPLFGAFLAARTSPWLVSLDVLAAAGLLAAGASLARGGSLLDLPPLALLARSVHAGLHALAAPAFLGGVLAHPGSDQSTAPRWVPVFRGLALAAPLLLVLGALLASADVLFAHLVDYVPDLDDVYVHVVLIGAGAWGMAALLRVAAAQPLADGPGRLSFLGPVEATVVLGSLTVLFAVFAATQLAALFGSGQHVVETAGLTYAEYARSGFFQLVVAAAITLVVLLAVDALTDVADPAGQRRLVLLSEASIGLTLVVVLSALRRLDLYENVYGLTMLRLYAGVFVGWVGVSLALLGGWLAAGSRRGWFPAAAVGGGLAALLVLNLVNPEAVVVRRNVALVAESGRFDSGYLTHLSADAIPEMVRALPGLDPASRASLLAVICRTPAGAEGGWAAWNAADDAAIEARNSVCR